MEDQKKHNLINFKPSATSPLHYSTVCKNRIRDIKHLQEKQFKHEIKMLEAMQQTAYDQVRFHRTFAITTLWPPLHNRKELEMTMKKFYRKPQKHSERINFIMKYGIE